MFVINKPQNIWNQLIYFIIQRLGKIPNKMRLLVSILIISSLVQQLLSIPCPAGKPFLYGVTCYSQCPWTLTEITYLDPSDNTCVLACPGPLYFADDSTKSCALTCPSYPIMTYYDHNRQKCVQRCSSNPSQFSYSTNRSCVDQCPSPLYADDSSKSCVSTCPTGQFYQVIGSSRICASKCYPNYYGDLSKKCVVAASCSTSSRVNYYGDDLSGLCVQSCPQNSDTFAQLSTNKCVHHCSLGTFADPTTLRCVSTCPTSPAYFGSNTTRMCHLQCIQGEFSHNTDRYCYKICPLQYFGDYSTRSCVQVCPQIQGTYADPQTKLCIRVCSPGYFADNFSRACVSAVDCKADLVGNPLTLQCIDGQKCPIGYFIDYTLFLCVKRCSASQYANLDTKVCGTNCPWNSPTYVTFKQAESRKCVQQCPHNPRTFSDNLTQSCVAVCPNNYFGTTVNYDCVLTCPDGFHGDSLSKLCVSTCTTNTSVISYYYSLNTSCLITCPSTTYKDDTTLTCVSMCPQNTFAEQTLRSCVAKCPDTTFADKFSNKCVSRCPALTKQYADSSTNICVDICPLIPDHFGQDINDGHRKCVSGCTLTDVYTQPISRTCAKQCDYTKGYFGDSALKKCVLKCPLGYGNPITKLCITTCPQSPIQTYGSNLTSTCVTKCPNNTYGDRTTQLCVTATHCPTNTYGDDSTNVCVSKCSISMGTFGDPVTGKCVKSCQFGYFRDNTTRLCTQTCNATAQMYKDPSTRQCVVNCPSKPDLYNDPAVKQCVPNCTSVLYQYKYQYKRIRKCVAMCPSSPVYFADSFTKTCVLKCANLTYKFVNNTFRGCLSYCPEQIFNVTHSVTLYEDNETWNCVSVCPPGYYAFKHPSDTSIRKCVKMCQIVNSVYYFADDVSRSCVTACPMKVHSTYGDRLVFKCVKICTRKQYRDQTTKQCTYTCPKLPIPYFSDNSTWNCSKKCPISTYAQSINSSCVKQCPTNYFGYKQKCLAQCPAGTLVFQDNTTWFCLDQCSNMPDYYSDAQNQKCVKNCTPGTYADNNTRSCVVAGNCSGITVADPLTYRCVSQCSKVPMYFLKPSTNICCPTCSDSLFAYNQTNLCVQSCPSPYYGVNSSVNYYCTQYCPTLEYKFIDTTRSNFRICVISCPQGYFSYFPKMQCLVQCPNGYYGLESNNQCKADCSPLYADQSTNMCVTTCGNSTTADDNTHRCKGRCKYGQFQQNKKCVTSCSIGLYADNLTRTCAAQCPEDPFTFADPFQKKCVYMCSPSYFGYLQNRTCKLSCPLGLFTELARRICMNPCPEDQFGDPDSLSCVGTCTASSFPYADPSTQQCVKKCSQLPDLFGLNNQCIDQCPNGKFGQNFTRTCLDKCPNISLIYKNQSFADNLTRRCVKRCSSLSYAYQNQTDNMCILQCPEGLFASQILQACVLQCPNYTFALNDTNQCVGICPNSQWGDIHSKTCMDGCYNNNQFSDNSTNMCVQRCPQWPDVYGQLSSNSCVLTCGSGLYAHPLERICVSNCMKPYYADPSSRLCVLQCPAHQFQFADDNLRRCVTACSNYSGVIEYADRTTKRCIILCPEIPQLLYGLNQTNTCQETCPHGTFSDNDTRLCLDRCIFQHPKFNWMDPVNNMCVSLCPLGYFADNNTKYCQSTCITSTYADNSTRRCVISCPVTPVSFATISLLGHRVCTYTCQSGLYADEISRSCVQKCPTLPFYYFHSPLKNKCVKQCLYPYFGQVQSQNCVLLCKQGFYGNLTTKKCQVCRSQCVTCSAYLQCLTCQIGFFLYEFQCVTSCPSYPILYYSLEISTKCFKKCPAPYYGLQSTKKCQLGCPISYYPKQSIRQCTTCPDGCLSCDSLGCIKCYSGYTYVNSTRTCNQHCNSTHIYHFDSKCYTSCPNGSFMTKDQVHCDPCVKECATCFGAAANCTKCAQKFYYQGLCIDACPTGYYVNQNMACISCTVTPQRCTLPPLTYKIKPFTQNYIQKAYVVFSRSVNMTLQQFVKQVQISVNGQAVKTNQFTAKVFNSTTYVVSFNKLTSLNQNSLSIGFRPGTIRDSYGNILTVSILQEKFQDKTGVTQDVVKTSQRVSNSTEVIAWVVLVFLLLLFLKGGYPVLLCFQVVQIVYLHTFLYANPMPYLQLKFLEPLKYFHFTFFPKIFQAGIKDKSYENLLNDVSFLANSSPAIFVWIIVAIVYLLFKLLSNRKMFKNKTVRKFAKKVIKYRMRYHIIHDAFWVTYLYTVFFAITQFKHVSFDSAKNIGNFVFALIVLIIYSIFTVYMVKLGNKCKQMRVNQVPRKLTFIIPQPSSFPMEIPFRYLRKILLCFALVMPYLQAQVIIMIMTNFVFLCYYICFMPAASKLTNYLNFAIEITYILIQGLFYGYFKLQNKTADQQFGFSIGLICIQAIILIMVLSWLLYRSILTFKTSQLWKHVYMKLTQNTDPKYLKQQQIKRDLQFDFGSLQNRTQNQGTEDLNISSKNLHFKKDKSTYFENNTIFQKQTKVAKKKKQKKKKQRIISSNSQDFSISLQESAIGNLQFNGKNHASKDEVNQKQLDEKVHVLKTKQTRIKVPDRQKTNNFLKIDNKQQHDLEQIVINNDNVEAIKKDKKQVNCVWDDIQFEQFEI